MHWKKYAAAFPGVLALGWAMSGSLPAPAADQRNADKSNMDLVGYSDLQARSA